MHLVQLSPLPPGCDGWKKCSTRGESLTPVILVRAASIIEVMKKLAIAFTLVLATLILATNSGQLQPLVSTIAAIFPFADKVVHFFFMGIWSLLANIAVSSARIRFTGHLHLTKVSALLICFSVVEEGSHWFLTYRVFSLADMFANALGIVAFGWLATVVADRLSPMSDVTAKELA